MNLGLGTLTELKAHLLNEGLRDQDTYDGAIANLGRFVAGRFETYCARKFGRTVADTFEFDANEYSVVLPRFPIEEITKIELREDFASGWVDQGDPDTLIDNLREKSGIVSFLAPLGTTHGRVRITYTGGFWFDLSADGSPGNVRSSQQGSVDLSANDESKAVTFDSEFTVAPNVDCRVVPPADAEVPIIDSRPSAITTAGFTALIGFPIPGAGYKLQYEATTSIAEAVPDSEMPEGATALPDAIKGAWLLQAEYIWKLRDKLGINLAGDTGGSTQLVSLSLAGLQLAPDIEATLKSFRRFS